MKDVNELMQEVLTADRLKLEDEIEDVEEEIALIENLFIVFFIVCRFPLLQHVTPDVFRRCGDNEQLLHRRKKKLTDKLERKREELEFIMKRLEEYS